MPVFVLSLYVCKKVLELILNLSLFIVQLVIPVNGLV